MNDYTTQTGIKKPTIVESQFSPEPGDQLWLSLDVQTTIVRPTGSLGYIHWVLDDAGNTFSVTERELRPGKPGVVGDPGCRTWIPRELIRAIGRRDTR